jgi:hypothetical protein
MEKWRLFFQVLFDQFSAVHSETLMKEISELRFAPSGMT